MAKISAKKKMHVPDIRFTVQVWKENGKYVAYAPELDLSSFGNSVPHAKARLREAVALFLEGAARLGTLKDILSEAGFERHGSTYRPRRVLARERLRLAVPAAS
jgi:predicted RNase H-like HicB family nuclease